jgi:hypothetical protein
MRIRYKRARKYVRKGWHHWFAWRPVFVGDYIVWLESVNRKYVVGSWPGEHDLWTYEILH